MPMKMSLQTSVSEKKKQKHLAEGCTNDCCRPPGYRERSSGPSKRLEASGPWHPGATASWESSFADSPSGYVKIVIQWDFIVIQWV